MKKAILLFFTLFMLCQVYSQQFYKHFDSEYIYNPQLNKYINFIYSSTFDDQCIIEKVDTIVSDTNVTDQTAFLHPHVDSSNTIFFRYIKKYDTLQTIAEYNRLSRKLISKYTIKLEKPDGVVFWKYLGNDYILGGAYHLFKVDLNTLSAKVIMDYDNPTFVITDMTYKGDELIAMVYNQTNKPYCSFYKLDINNPNTKEFLFAGPDSLYFGDGLQIVPTSCSKYNAYYIGAQEDPQSSDFLRDYYQLDLETGVSTKLCRSKEDFYNNYDRPFHYQAPGNPFCMLIANLDADKSTGATADGGYQSSVFCASYPHLADLDVALTSKIGTIDSIQCFFESGDIDNLWKAGNEVLTSPPQTALGAATFEQRDYQHWVLKNNGKVIPNDNFIRLLHAVGYRNLLGNQMTERTRKVGIVCWVGKTRSDTVYAFLHAKGKVNAGIDTSLTICPGEGTIQLAEYIGKHDSLGAWKIGSETSDGLFVNGVNPYGAYQYLVSKDECRDTATVSLLKGLVLENILGQDTILCDVTNYRLDTKVNARSYVWQDGSTQNYLAVQQAGIYTVTVTSADNCQSLDSISIGIGKNTFLSIDTTVCTFQWLSNLLKNDTTVCVRTLQPDGCTSQVCFKVKIDCKFDIPNAFTPNGDGTNDTFGLLADENHFVVTSMKIFDRWGNMVFDGKSEDKLFPFWDGQLRNDAAPSEIYQYVLTLRDRDGKVNTIKGEVLLIR